MFSVSRPLFSLYSKTSCRAMSNISSHLDSPFISVDTVKNNLDTFKIIDCSYKALVGPDYDGYRSAHLPGAIYFDIDQIANQSNPIPHSLPSAAQFSAWMDSHGISNSTLVVIYDRPGLLAASRLWFTFKAFGAEENVRIMAGGIDAWQAAGYPVEQGESPSATGGGSFTAVLDNKMMADIDEVLQCGKEDSVGVVVDARSPGRFNGTDPEPREGLSSGHMSRALNIPYGALIETIGTQGGQVLKSKKDLEKIVEQAGLSLTDLNRRVVTSCGSGLTAATLHLALHTLGFSNVGLYDGSWTEYATGAEAAGRPIVKK